MGCVIPRCAGRSPRARQSAAVLLLALVAVLLCSRPVFLLGQGAAPPGLSALLDGSGYARIAAGEFLMGSNMGTDSERPAHRVRISSPFEMGRFEVTQAQWDAVMRTAHQAPGQAQRSGPEADVNPSHFRGPAFPVENVSWDAVQRFVAALNARDPSHVYRLPTEAEWEYAARAGRTEDAPGNVPEISWFADNSLGQTHPAGEKAPNAWGLHDVQGNVSEWVADWFAADYYQESPPNDPPGPGAGSYRVYRGCSWLGSQSDCRPSARAFNFPTEGYYNVGFRLVRTSK